MVFMVFSGLFCFRNEQNWRIACDAMAAILVDRNNKIFSSGS